MLWGKNVVEKFYSLVPKKVSELSLFLTTHRIAKGALKGFQFTATTVILTVPTTTHHSFKMIKNNLNNSTAATNVAPKPFSISFWNIRGLSSNINPVHHPLQSINPCALFINETSIKPLDPSNSTVLSPHLKCPGYELFSSFFPNGGVCEFIRSDVQTLQLFWLKNSLLHATKYICTLYRSPNSNNHELLFDHLSKSIETIT